jgi:hypothetical protein
MDLSKYPIEKLVYFVAGIIPGFVALLIYWLAVPGSFGWFFAMGFLGYKTKLGVVLLTAFIIGNSLTQFLSSILGAMGGVIGALQRYQPPNSYDVAPWRDPRWRTALKNHLQAQAPKDTQLISQRLYDMRKRVEVDSLPETQRPLALLKLEGAKLDSEIDDRNWADWYDHFHQIVLVDQKKRDFQWHVHQGLLFNLEATGLYVLISVLFVPSIRHWWCIFPACMWVLILIAGEYSGLTNLMNKWSTLSRQTKYLMAQEPLKEPSTTK